MEWGSYEMRSSEWDLKERNDARGKGEQIRGECKFSAMEFARIVSTIENGAFLGKSVVLIFWFQELNLRNSFSISHPICQCQNLHVEESSRHIHLCSSSYMQIANLIIVKTKVNGCEFLAPPPVEQLRIKNQVKWSSCCRLFYTCSCSTRFIN